MTQVALTNLTKTYPGGAQALRGVSLTVEPGELVVVFGPSGCGKTTTLRLIAGLETPSSGTIAIDGQDVAGVNPRDRGVAMVFQGSPLYPHMTVRQNMAFPLRMRKVAKAERTARIESAAKLLEIQDLLGRKPGELSGGQRQRAALGRVIVQQPRVYLFDEPLSDLDERLRKALATEIRSLHRRLGATSVYVTHDRQEARDLADRVVVMRGGMIERIAAPAEL